LLSAAFGLGSTVPASSQPPAVSPGQPGFPDEAGLAHPPDGGGRPLPQFVPSSPRRTVTRDRVLVVDDDPGIRGLAREALTAAGYEVGEASCRQDIRAGFDALRPDVVLLDVSLPDGSTIELLSELRDEWPATEVVIMTDPIGFDLAGEAAKSGVFALLCKPLRAEELVEAVGQACAHKAMGA